MDNPTVSTKELIKKIRYIGDTYPKDELDRLLKREDTITELIDILNLVSQKPELFLSEPERFDHIYAAILLGQLGAREAFYPFLEILKLPNDLALDLYDEYLVTTAGRILADTYPGEIIMDGNSPSFPDLDALFELIDDISLDECIRATGIQAITSLVLQKRISGEMIEYYYHDLLRGDLDDETGYIYTILIDSCMVLNFRNLYDDIEEVFAQKKVDPFHMSLDDVEAQFRNYDPMYANDYLPITNIHEEFTWWNGQFQPDNTRNIGELKVGRNEPCPCGSGKKYKKCCGKS
jgi:hypothetical protein